MVGNVTFSHCVQVPLYIFLSCSMFHHMHLPSRIGVFDYSLFRRGIAPAWEDPSLVQGGRWVAKFPHRMELLNVVWLHTAMAVIGKEVRTLVNPGTIAT